MAALKGSRYCWSHSPDNAAAHRANATIGGMKRQRGASAPPTLDDEIPEANLTTLAGGIAALERIYESLRKNPSDRAITRARALTAVVKEAIAAHRATPAEDGASDLEQQLDAAEAEAKAPSVMRSATRSA